MRIPRHWTKASYTGRNLEGKDLTCTAWGWSFNGPTAATDDARSRARRVFDCLLNGRRPDPYEYTDRPLREEIVETMGHDGKDLAIITRNRYGALVLNTASVLFVDIDFPRITPNGLVDAILLSISGTRRKQRQAVLREQTLESVRNWAQRNRNYRFRVYRTYAGLRLLFVDRRYDPCSDQVARMLDELGSDPLYRTLTSKQECFRARLTPKPWRCGAKVPPNQYPWTSEEQERRYRAWQDRYTQSAEGYAVCELIECYGDTITDDEISVVLERHDSLTCADRQMRLA
jgi:hypothetical protein